MDFDIKDLSPEVIGKRVSISSTAPAKPHLNPETQRVLADHIGRTWVGVLKSFYIDEKFFGFMMDGSSSWIQITLRYSDVTVKSV